MEEGNVEMTNEVIPFAKANGDATSVAVAAEAVAEAKVAEAVSMQDQIKMLEAQLKQERIDRLLERRTGLIGWATANQLEQMETQRALLELGWKPPKQG